MRKDISCREETPIFIPENLKHRRIDSNTTDEPMAKQSRMDYVESNEEFLDVETMMKDFVPAPILK